MAESGGGFFSFCVSRAGEWGGGARRGVSLVRVTQPATADGSGFDAYPKPSVTYCRRSENLKLIANWTLDSEYVSKS